MPKHYDTPDMKLHKKWLRNPDIRLSNKNKITGTSSRKSVDSIARTLTLGIASAKKRVGTGDLAKMRKRRSFRGTQKQKIALMQKKGFARHISSLKTREAKMRAKRKFLKEISQTEARKQNAKKKNRGTGFGNA